MLDRMPVRMMPTKNSTIEEQGGQGYFSSIVQFTIVLPPPRKYGGHDDIHGRE